MNSLKNKSNYTVLDIYNILYNSFGPQGWWPGDSKFEILVGAILTQNTTWKNVEKSIANLKKRNLMSFEMILDLDEKDLAMAIKSSGFYNQKAKRLKNVLLEIKSKYGSFEDFLKMEKDDARKFLLSQNGIGKETADSIILYAMEKPAFVVDAYTFRIFKRFGFNIGMDYEFIKNKVEEDLNRDVEKMKEFHALLVELGKTYCKKVPKCDNCPLEQFCEKNV